MRSGGRVTLLALVMLLAACGGSSGGGGATPQASPTPSVPPTYTAYVLDSMDGTVVPIPLATGVPGAPIKVGSGYVFGLAIPKDGKLAYISGGGNLAVLNLATGQLGTPIAVQPGTSGPIGVAVTPDGKKAYAINYNAGTVIPVNLATGQVGQPIMAKGNPQAIVMAPDGKTAYVAVIPGPGNPNSPVGLLPIDTASDQLGTLIPLAGSVIALAFAPDGKTLYAGYYGLNAAGVKGSYLATIDLASGRATTIWQSQFIINGLAISPDGKKAWMSYSFTYTVAGVQDPAHVFTLDLATLTPSTPIIIGGPTSQPGAIVIARSN